MNFLVGKKRHRLQDICNRSTVTSKCFKQNCHQRNLVNPNLGYCFNPSLATALTNPLFWSQNFWKSTSWGLALCGFGWWSNASKNVAGGVRVLVSLFEFSTDDVFGQKGTQNFTILLVSRKWRMNWCVSIQPRKTWRWSCMFSLLFEASAVFCGDWVASSSCGDGRPWQAMVMKLCAPPPLWDLRRI